VAVTWLWWFISICCGEYSTNATRTHVRVTFDSHLRPHGRVVGRPLSHPLRRACKSNVSRTCDTRVFVQYMFVSAQLCVSVCVYMPFACVCVCVCSCICFTTLWYIRFWYGFYWKYMNFDPSGDLDLWTKVIKMMKHDYFTFYP
jgi:hypothetical protein